MRPMLDHRQPPCIVLGLETQIGLCVVRELGRAGVRVIGIAQEGGAIGRSSRYLTASIVVAEPRSELLVQAIRAIGERYGPCLLLAISETNLSWLAAISSAFGQVTPVLPQSAALPTRLDLRYKPGFGDRLLAGRFKLTPLILSAQFNAENWSLTSEYAFRRTSVSDFGRFFYNGTADGRSYYLQGSYRLAPRWEALLRYDAYYADNQDRDGKGFAAATGMPGLTRFAKDWTAGHRFGVTPQ